MEEERAQSNLSRGDDVETIAGAAVEPPPSEGTRVPRKRFVGRRTAAAPESNDREPTAASKNDQSTSTAVQPVSARRAPRALNRVPADIQNDADLNAAIALLPPNYDFEVQKTVHRIRSAQARHIGLQLPEGLLLFATTLADIFSRFGASRDAAGALGPRPQISILGDVTYGACCVDDFTARALGCDLLVHYAHSCLIPRAGGSQGLQVLYVFVDIGIDMAHLLATIERNFKAGTALALFGTVQFNAALHAMRSPLERAGFTILVPQSAPLSRGEILGCTAPSLHSPSASTPAPAASPSRTQPVHAGIDTLLYVGDGRFHLEAAMIANPTLPAYRYDPYSRELTRERYEHAEMRDVRAEAITTARKAQRWGLILGALGRQGNPATLALIEKILRGRGFEVTKLVLSEVMPAKLALLPEIDVWVQVACPRLSIDWGYAFPRPLLNPYEALVALNVRDAAWEKETGQDRANGRTVQERLDEAVYPMDYYASDGLGRVTLADVQRGDGLVKVGK